MANIIPPDHVDDLPIVELNQPDAVLVIPEPVLVDEDEDPKEEKFEEKEEPQEEEDMEVDIEEDKNESEFTFPNEETNHVNPSYNLEPKEIEGPGLRFQALSQNKHKKHKGLKT
ncbi:hypothetical protein Tco_0201706 [Tanacetum coccineum]